MDLTKKIQEIIEKVMSSESKDKKKTLECYKIIEQLEFTSLTNEAIKNLIETLGERLDE